VGKLKTDKKHGINAFDESIPSVCVYEFAWSYGSSGSDLLEDGSARYDLKEGCSRG
jgi:hypothetical protein